MGDQLWGSGVTFIDTSPMYGQSERLLGIAIRNRRERVQLATKVWTTGLAKGRAQIEQSFKLLGTEPSDA